MKHLSDVTPNKSSEGSAQSSQQESERNSEESSEEEGEESSENTPQKTNRPLIQPKTYSCQFCSEEFRIKASLAMHIRFECGPVARPEMPSTPIHDDEESNSRERYKCEQCNRSYKYAKSLPLHLRFECGRKDCLGSIRVPNEETQPDPDGEVQIVAVVEKVIKCSYCDETFNKRQELDQHLPNCESCQAEVSKLNGGKERFECSSCSKSYKYWKSLLLHRRLGCKEDPETDQSSSEVEVEN